MDWLLKSSRLALSLARFHPLRERQGLSSSLFGKRLTRAASQAEPIALDLSQDLRKNYNSEE